MSEIKVRFANVNEVSLIYALIRKKAEFNRNIGAFSEQLKTSEEKISKTLFNRYPFAYVLFASTLEREIGFALYCFRYSSFAGQPSIWLDDLYVNENMRSQGAGTALMTRLVEISQENYCTHLAWTADKRNTRGLNFYHRLGAKISKQENNRCFFYLDSLR